MWKISSMLQRESVSYQRGFNWTEYCTPYEKDAKLEQKRVLSTPCPEGVGLSARDTEQTSRSYINAIQVDTEQILTLVSSSREGRRARRNKQRLKLPWLGEDGECFKNIAHVLAYVLQIFHRRSLICKR